MPRLPKEFNVPGMPADMAAQLRPYTEALDRFFRYIRMDIEKLENIDYADLLSQKINDTPGVDGTFTTADGKTVTISKGIVTSIES